MLHRSTVALLACLVVVALSALAPGIRAEPPSPQLTTTPSEPAVYLPALQKPESTPTATATTTATTGPTETPAPTATPEPLPWRRPDTSYVPLTVVGTNTVAWTVLVRNDTDRFMPFMVVSRVSYINGERWELWRSYAFLSLAPGETKHYFFTSSTETDPPRIIFEAFGHP